MNKNGIDNFDMVDAGFSNFDTDFSNAVDPATAEVLAQAGTSIIGGAIQNRRQKELDKDATDKLIDKTCGKEPRIKRFLGKNTKAYNDYLACSQKTIEQQGVLQQQALDLQMQRLAQDSMVQQQQEDEGMSTGAKIGIAVGILAILGVGAYFVIKNK
jgi:hypothetical protein